MKRTLIVLLALTAFAVAGCKDKPKEVAPQQPAATPAMPGQMPPGHPGAAAPGADPHAGLKATEIPAGSGLKGTVAQTMNSGGYTYVEVADEAGKKVWLALPEMKVSVGDKIEYPDSPPMTNFHSKTLNRTFDKVLFVPGIRINK